LKEKLVMPIKVSQGKPRFTIYIYDNEHRGKKHILQVHADDKTALVDVARMIEDALA